MNWRYCKDELPKKYGYYLVSQKWKYYTATVSLARFFPPVLCGGKHKWESGNIRDSTTVYAWMPLPEPAELRKEN